MSKLYVLVPNVILFTLSDDDITAVNIYVAIFENWRFPVVWFTDIIFELVPDGRLKFVLKFKGVSGPMV